MLANMKNVAINVHEAYFNTGEKSHLDKVVRTEPHSSMLAAARGLPAVLEDTFSRYETDDTFRFTVSFESAAHGTVSLDPEELGCVECCAPVDDRNGWREFENADAIELTCPEPACALACAVRWATDVEPVRVFMQDGFAAPLYFWGKAITDTMYLELQKNGEPCDSASSIIDKLTGDKVQVVEKPARLDARGELEEIPVYKVVHTGWSNRRQGRGGGSWKVSKVISHRYNATEGMCIHLDQGRAQECKAARDNGATGCIGHGNEEG